MSKEIVYHVTNEKTNVKNATLVLRREDDSDIVFVGWSQSCKGDNFCRRSGRETAIEKIESIDVKTAKSIIPILLSDEWGLKDNCSSLTTFLIGNRIDMFLEKASKYFKEAKYFMIPTRDGSIIEVTIDL